MRRKICTFGAVCALLLTACGKGNAVVQTSSGAGQASNMEQVPEGMPARPERTESQTITVSGRETVKTVPDMAEIVYAVSTQEKDAAACQKANTEKVNQLLAALKALGIEEKSIQTSGYDISPRYDWDKNGEIVGYEATTQVTVSDISLAQVGEVLEESVESGVNQVQSLAFLASDYDKSYQEALKMAVNQAQEKAQALADASGCTLGRPIHITEHGSDQSTRYVNVNAVQSMKREAAADMAMSVMAGEIDVEASISVDFAIQ
ncbi:MAG: SIMPL domain-containing protein [Lachnospiraceae bacterium]|jgi:uncharacterized protein YggE|nr:SIMPL domain-containing protein [Lachnospiraceae bacterium]